MKILIPLIFVFITTAAQAQFKIGVNAGLPVGKAEDYYSFSAGLDAYYMFGNTPDALLKFGLGTGFLNYFGDEIDGEEIDDTQFIPIAAAGRVYLLSALIFGADLGYGVGISDDNDGGAYGRVLVGLNLGNTIELNAFYHLVKVVKGSDFASAGLGLLIEF